MKRIQLGALSIVLLIGLCGAAQAFTPWDMPFFGDGWFNDNRSGRPQIMAPDLSIKRMVILPSNSPGVTARQQVSWKLLIRVRNIGSTASRPTTLHIYHSAAEQGGGQGFDPMPTGNRQVMSLGPGAYQDFDIPIPAKHGAMGQWSGMYMAVVDPPDQKQWFGQVQELPWPSAESNNARMIQGILSR